MQTFQLGRYDISGLKPKQASVRRNLQRQVCRSAAQDPILLRVARGEDAERTPVWLMRQAGRYMAEFRQYSDRLGFRERSETPEIALELSLQPWRAFKPDGVIMFSDILTPLPALGIEFDVIKGKGPIIPVPIRSMEQVRALIPLSDPDVKLPFVQTVLRALREEVGNKSTVLGFVGTPWTLAGYVIQGGNASNVLHAKEMMFKNPALLHALLDHLTEAVATYTVYQIDSGAQVVQLFDSWAKHLTPNQFAEFSLPYAEKVIQRVREQRPGVPLIFHANGGTGKMELMGQAGADMVGVDGFTGMAEARRILGAETRVQGNVDNTVLRVGTEEAIRASVRECLLEAGPRGHILNVGDGIMQQTPEENVGLFCDLARESASVFRDAPSLVAA